MINIDFLIAGCDTRCRHCYVNGGPAPLMPAGEKEDNGYGNGS